MTITHTAAITEPNDPDYDVSKDAWEAAHAVANGSLVAAKLSATATDKVFGRSTAGAGNGEEITLTAFGRSLIDDAAASNARTTLGLVTGTDVPTQAAFDDHSTRHDAGGADALAIDAAAATGSLRTLGTGATQAAVGSHGHAGAGVFVGCRATANAVTSLANGAYTTIALATESFDSDGFHDLVTNNSRLTVPTGKGGKYLIVAMGAFIAAAGGKRGVKILLNGATTLDFTLNDAAAVGTYAVRQQATSIYELAVGDYIQLQQFQDTGGAINSTTETTLALTFLGT